MLGPIFFGSAQCCTKPHLGCSHFEATHTAAIFDAILNKAPAPPSRINPDIPADLERTINKALEKDRDVRCQSAAEIRADLKRLKRDTSSGKMSAAKIGRASCRERGWSGVVVGA